LRELLEEENLIVDESKQHQQQRVVEKASSKWKDMYEELERKHSDDDQDTIFNNSNKLSTSRPVKESIVYGLKRARSKKAVDSNTSSTQPPSSPPPPPSPSLPPALSLPQPTAKKIRSETVFSKPPQPVQLSSSKWSAILGVKALETETKATEAEDDDQADFLFTTHTDTAVTVFEEERM